MLNCGNVELESYGVGGVAEIGIIGMDKISYKGSFGVAEMF